MGQRQWLNIALAGAALAAFALLTIRDESDDSGIEIEVRDAPHGIDEIRVAVTGAVVEPGVVTAEPGERVADVVARVAGLAPDADLNALNLSRRVQDEDHILVPRLGERAPLLDLNTATAEELAALPAIGPAYAAAIIRARAERGPFSSTDELLELRIVPERTYERVRDLVTVR